MAITRTVMVDDDGSGTTGTILNNAWKQELYNQIDGVLIGGSGVTANVVTTTLTGTQHNLPCGVASLITLVKCQNSGELTLTSVAFTTPPREGDALHIVGGGAGIINLAHNHASGTVKFWNNARSAHTPIAAGGTATYIFNAGYWILHTHEQGAWITPPFSAADYSGGWSGLPAGAILEAKYRLNGRTLLWSLYVFNAYNAGGAVSRKVMGGFISTGTPVGMCSASEATVAVSGFYQGNASVITFYKNINAGGFAVGTFILASTGITEVA